MYLRLRLAMGLLCANTSAQQLPAPERQSLPDQPEADDIITMLREWRSHGVVKSDGRGLSGAALEGMSPDATAEPRVRRSETALWPNIKRELLSKDGRKYFESAVKDALLPWLKGTVLSAEPRQRPAALVLAISDSNTPEVILRLKNVQWQDTALEASITIGSQVEFAGVPITFSETPFVVTLNVTLDKLKYSAQRGR